jgi:hypothetical protein
MSLRELNACATDSQLKTAGVDAATLVRALVAGNGDWQMAKATASKWGMEGEVSPRVLDALKAKAALSEAMEID